MFDVSTFLLRWIFLSNLCRDVVDIQTLPTQPYVHPPPPPHPHLPQRNQEAIWKEQCIRGILSYPPGTQRTLVMDALRVELVHQLAQKLQLDHSVMKQHDAAQELERHRQHQRQHPRETGAQVTVNDDDESSSEDSDPYIDADLEIVRAFEQQQENDHATRRNGEDPEEEKENLDAAAAAKGSQKVRKASFVIDEYGSSSILEADVDEETTIKEDDNVFIEQQQPQQQQKLPWDRHGTKLEDNISEAPSLTEVEEASRSLQLTRDYLPQLVSLLLKSPPAFDPQLANPIQKLRSLILSQCLDDPGAGIELCWLLEAEVGRAWKTLFEHRQQTGRRLIIVLPAEKAAVLAKIGTEKREAFDLLQDAEQATAFGYTSSNSYPDHHHHNHQHSLQQHQQQQPFYHNHPAQGSDDPLDDAHHHTRLPSSLSLRRCSHFGDTMHLIDKLTRISMDLRFVPEQDRDAVLQDSLYELNRRIRRRMVTRGDVSLDVEDNRSPYDWPQVDDMSVDMIKHSVHLPFVPQTQTWPDGGTQDAFSNFGQQENSSKKETPSRDVVRVLNIVVPESRILSSRERCPFLIHVEVADTGLEAGNARLYASGVSGLGSTVSEALSMSSAGASSAAASSRHHRNGVKPFGIPSELLQQQQTKLPRGGSQQDNHYYDDSGYLHDPFEGQRQHEYEQLHQDLQARQTMVATRPPQHHLQVPHTPKLTLGLELLDNIFGRQWNEKCREIREASPYGHVKGWRLASFILKAGEDIRREAFVMQIISKLQQWFQEEIPASHRPFMRPYTIMCVGADAGLVECISNAKSLDEVKKRTDGFETLRDYFERAYGPPRSQQPPHSGHPGQHPMQVPYGQQQQQQQSPASTSSGMISFETAQDNFLRSLVGYSLVCYILQVKDRHNANILIDRLGHIIHIDFGFVLGDTPKMGKVPLFNERAPFKLSADFWEVLGGWNYNSGGLGVRFCKMFEIAFACASSHAEEIAALTEATMLSLDANPRAARAMANGVRSRLKMRGLPASREQKMFVIDLVNAALSSWGTPIYDLLQRSMNGYL